jgi:C_GCAxxG_C_C family probable redox protein
MIVRDGKRFNCSESVLIMIDEGHPLPGFEPNIMKTASSLGGGVGGWGSACGAATGAVIAFSLIHGTDGVEDLGEFRDKRQHLREMSQEFLRKFEDAFGSVNCIDLLGVDRRTEEGKARYQEIKDQCTGKCNNYVDWAAKRVLVTLGEG